MALAMTDHADPCATEEPCAMCDRQAAHKVAEDDSRNRGLFRRHPLTNYLCCEHFTLVMGSLAARMGCEETERDHAEDREGG